MYGSGTTRQQVPKVVSRMQLVTEVGAPGGDPPA